MTTQYQKRVTNKGFTTRPPAAGLPTPSPSPAAGSLYSKKGDAMTRNVAPAELYQDQPETALDLAAFDLHQALHALVITGIRHRDLLRSQLNTLQAAQAILSHVIEMANQ